MPYVVPELRLTLLGSPGLEFGGAPVEADTRKALALVAYLALTKRRHGRDALAAFLWPEYAQSRARAALRRTLASLGEARSGSWLEARRESLGVTGEGLWMDVDRFRGLLAACRGHGHPENEVCDRCLTPLAEAAALYRDDFMAGFTLRDSAAFDDWQFFQAEELRRELAGALERLVSGHGERAAWEAATSYARRWLSLDLLHEPAHRALMRVYAASGRRSAALRQYRECVRILDRELGVAPLPETAELYARIKEDRPRPAARRVQPEPPPPARPAFESRLVGRDHEWSTLLEAYAATGPDGYVVALEGEAGIGKTRLAEEVLAHAGERGSRTLGARCYEGESSLAYGPLVEMIGTAARRPDAPLREIPERHLVEAARLLPDLSAAVPGRPLPAEAPPLGGPGSQSRFYEGVCETLLALCGGPTPGVLLFDDLHWADEATLDLLTYLIRRLRGRPILALLTWRSEYVPEGHRLRGLLAETRRAGRATGIELHRLRRESVYELARLAAGDETKPADALGARLYEETEGLPLFLREYLAAVVQDAPASGDWALPGGVRDLLHGQLREASETGRQLLTAAAAVGRSADLDTLREVSGRGEEETITAIEELVGRGLLRETRDLPESLPAYDFSHEKLRALVYEETGLARRRLLHRRIADTLLERAQRRRETGPLAAQVSHHLRLAGRDEEAARYLVLAGEHARSVYANAEALDHLRAALALGHPEAAALNESIGDLHTLLGDYGAALASYETATALRDPGDEPGGLARLEQKLGGVHQRRGDWEQAISHLDSALAAAEDLPAAALARLYADRSLSDRHLGRPGQALESANRALELAGEAEDSRALAQAHNALGVLHRDAGDRARSREHLERSLALAHGLDDPGARVAALNNLALARAEDGGREAALALAREALTLCAAQGDRHREAALHNNLADLLHETGQTEESMQHLKRAVSIFAEIGGEGEPRPEIWKLIEW